MIVKVNKGILKYKGSLSNKNIILKIDKVKEGRIYLVIKEEGNDERGYVEEFKTVFEAPNVTNEIAAAKYIHNYLIKQYDEEDVEIKESEEYMEDKDIFPKRISISIDSILFKYHGLIGSELKKDYPKYIKDTYVVLYPKKIFSKHRALLKKDNNVLIEE